MNTNNDLPTTLKPSRTKWLISGIIVLFLLLIPYTSWVLQEEFVSVVNPANTFAPLLTQSADNTSQNNSIFNDSAQSTIDQKYHDDYLIQVGAVILSNGLGQSRDKLVSLAARFPEQPGIFAHIIRSDSCGRVQIDRDSEEDQLAANPPTGPIASRPPSSSADLAAFDAECVRGESLDPTNAFFPFVRGAGLFAQHKDNQAIASIEKASTEPKWDDYTYEDMSARRAVADNVLHQHDVLRKTALQAAMLLPHLSLMRSEGREATYLAMVEEQNGRVKDGIALRMALMRVGALMRTNSSTIIGMLVGIAIEQGAMSRPNGAPAIAASRGEISAVLTAQRSEAFHQLLMSSGNAKDASWVSDEATACTQARAVSKEAVNDNLFVQQIITPVIAWTVASIVLVNVLWLVMMGFVTSLSSPRNENGAIPAYIPSIMLFIQVMLAGVVCFRGVTVSQLWAALSTVSVANTPNLALPISILIGCLVLTLAMPITMAVKLIKDAHSDDPRPVSAVNERVTSICVFATICLAMVTFAVAGIEAHASAAMDQASKNEGAYYAHQLGKEWPGITPSNAS